jgi:transposase-like protein
VHSGNFAAAALDIHRGIGLTGLPDAIGVTWPQAVVQLCVVHLIRASLRYASRKYWAPPPRDLRAIYSAADETAAAAALDAFTAALAAALPRDRQVVAGALGRVHPVPGRPARDPQCDLHDEPVSR